MGLPDWTDEGLLPPGCWRATLQEVQERLVADTPHAASRQVVLHGLLAYLGQIRGFLSAGRVWLDGPFVTRNSLRCDPALSLVVFPGNVAEIDLLASDRYDALTTLFTMRDIVVGGLGQTRYIERLEPIGTHIAAHLGDEGDDLVWAEWCSKIPPDVDAVSREKGYVEVEL